MVDLDVLVAMSDEEQNSLIDSLTEAELRELLVAVLDAYGRTEPVEAV